MTIHAHLSQFNALLGNPSVSRYAFLLQHGRSWWPSKATFALPRMTPGHCFRNAGELAIRNPDLTYVEGLVSVGGLPIDHAWLLRPDGTVFDPTLAPAFVDQTYDRVGEYFGVPFKTDFLVKWTDISRYWGLLDYPRNKSANPLFNGDLSPEDFLYVHPQ